MTDELLLIAAYMRKQNNIALGRAETDAEIAAGVRVDLAKIKRERAAFDAAKTPIPEQAQIIIAAAEAEAAALERA